MFHANARAGNGIAVSYQMDQSRPPEIFQRVVCHRSEISSLRIAIRRSSVRPQREHSAKDHPGGGAVEDL